MRRGNEIKNFGTQWQRLGVKVDDDEKYELEMEHLRNKRPKNGDQFKHATTLENSENL